MRTILLATVLFLAGAIQAAAERHVRVILDVSQSMRSNDPSGHALTSTSILYSLARHELGVDGTFRVLPFDTPPDPKCPDRVPSGASSSWIEPVPSAPGEEFANRIHAIRYDAPCTFFYPYLETSLRDLAGGRSGRDVSRTVFIVTDGLTEEKTRVQERSLLEGLVPKLRDAGIDVWVLAFGPTATENQKFFEEIFRFNTAGGVRGGVFADPLGSQIIDTMIRIFEASFAYESQAVSGTTLDLTGGAYRRHVAILALYQPPKQAEFSLRPLPNPVGNSTKGFSRGMGKEVAGARPAGSGKPISYGVLWVNEPDPRAQQLVEAGRAPSRIAVLRPRNVRIEITSAGKAPTDVAMVGAPMRLRVVVSPADGSKADPGPVSVQFRAMAVRSSDAPGGYEYYPKHGWLPPASGGAYVPGEGRIFEIQPLFETGAAAFTKPPRDGRPYFDGYIEVEVQDRGHPVAQLPSPQQVRIYPYLSLRPDPQRTTLAHGESRTLAAGQDGCSRFKFRTEGTLAETDYSLAAEVDSSALPAPLRGSRIFLDRIDVQAWKNGRKFTRRRLADHEFQLCIVTPRRTAGGTELEIPVRFSLWQAEDDPYRNLDTVRPIAAIVNVESTGVLQLFRPVFLLLTGLLVLAALYLLARQLRMPSDFRVAVAEGEGGSLVTKAPAEAAMLDGILHHSAERPVLSLSGGNRIGSIVPADRDLFSFRCAKGFFDVSRRDASGDWVPAAVASDGSVDVAAHHVYRVRGSDGSVHQFRTEYEPQRRSTS